MPMRLRGIQFVGPNGTPAPFNFGNISGVLFQRRQRRKDRRAISIISPFRSGPSPSSVMAATNSTDNHLRLARAQLRKILLGKQQLCRQQVWHRHHPARQRLSRSRVSARRWTRWASPAFRWAPATSTISRTNGAHLIDNSLSTEAQSLGVPVSTNRRQLVPRRLQSRRQSRATTGRGTPISSMASRASIRS